MLARGEPRPTGRATHGRPAAFSPEAIVRRRSRQPSPSCGHLQRAYIKCFPRHNIRNNFELDSGQENDVYFPALRVGAREDRRTAPVLPDDNLMRYARKEYNGMR